MAGMTASALPSSWTVRPLGMHDVDSLLHVQTVCYGDTFLESYSYLLPVKGFHQQFEIIHLSGDILFDTF